MYAIPFLFPVYYSCRIAYDSTHISNSPKLTVTNHDSSESRSISSEEYDKIYQTRPGYKIKTELQPFLDRIGIRKDLIITGEIYEGHVASAMGTNYFNKGKAIIQIAPNFQHVDKDAYHFVLKHEIGHIKDNHVFTEPIVFAICSIAAGIFFVYLAPASTLPLFLFAVKLIGITCTILTIHKIAIIIFSQYCEREADDFAIAESSDEELKGGRRFFLSSLEQNLEYRKTIKTIWNKIFTSSTGELRFGISSHPSFSSRIKKIEDALKQRNVQIDDQEESAKIVKLANFEKSCHDPIANPIDLVIEKDHFEMR